MLAGIVVGAAVFGAGVVFGVSVVKTTARIDKG